MKHGSMGVAMLATLVLVGCGKQEAPPQPAAADNGTTVTAPAAGATEAGAASSTGTPPAADAAPADAAVMAVADTSATAGTPTATTTLPAPTTAASATPASSTATSAPAAPSMPAAKPATATPAPASTTAAAPAPSGKDPGTLLRAESLRERPAADAPELAQLAAGSSVNIVTREGGWYQVAAAGKTGWVRMLSVRRSEAASTSVAGIAGIASGRTGTGKVVTTTGVRGLDSGDLQAATFDEARIAKAESLRVSKSDAAAFAKAGGLVTQDVAALPAPAK